MPKTLFSEVEDFYLSGHLDEEPRALAKVLGRPRSHAAVAKRIEELRAAQPPAKKRSLLQTSTVGGQQGRVVAMTGAASAAADRAQGQGPPKKKPEGDEVTDGFDVPPGGSAREAYLARMKGVIHNPNGG